MRRRPRLVTLWLLVACTVARAEDLVVSRRDFMIDAVDPGIRLSVREVVAGAGDPFPAGRIVIFVHGYGLSGRPSFDTPDPEGSWAEWMARKGYAVYLFDIRDCGWSTREKAMTEPPGKNPGAARSYLAIRDVGAVVDHVRSRRGTERVVLLGWSWGGTLAAWYASLHPEKVQRLVLFAALYSGREAATPFEPAGAYDLRPASPETLRERLDKVLPQPEGEPPRLPSRIQALAAEARLSDPTSATRDPPTYRVPNGAAEDLHEIRIGRTIFSATSIYAPTLVVTAAADGIVPPEHGEALMRDLTHASVKRAEVIPGATHLAQFEARRGQLFSTVDAFLRESLPAASVP